MDAVPFEKIAGGRAAVEKLYAETALVSAIGQARLQRTLDLIGPPGQMRWDPVAGELVMRGKLFAAEQLGSFDGESWLWSWANPHLAIPEAKTTIARGLRDRGAAFTTPMIAAADERIPYLFGTIGVGLSDAEAYYIANQSQVYLFAPGQLAAATASPIDQLRTAVAAIEGTGMTKDIALGLPAAAKLLGLPLATASDEIVIGEGRDVMRFPIGGGTSLLTLGLCFVSKSVTIDDVHHHLRAVRGVAEMKFVKHDDHTLEFASHGLTIRIARSDKLKDVMREAKRSNQEEAKRYGAVLIISTGTTADYAGGTCAIGGGGFMGKMWVPTGMLEQPVSGVIVPSPALDVVARLNAIKDSLAYDVLLGLPYPKA